MQAVNTTLIDLYWKIGEMISRRVASAEWGEGAVDRLVRYIALQEPGTVEAILAAMMPCPCASTTRTPAVE